MESEKSGIKNQCKSRMLNMISLINKELYEFYCWSEEAVNIIMKQNNINDEMNEEIIKLNSAVNDMEISCESMKTSLDEKSAELREHMFEMKESETSLLTLTEILEDFEHQYDETKQPVLCEVDKSTLDLSREKLDFYKKITNIDWDFTVPLSSGKACGYISNKSINYIQGFKIQKNENCADEIWAEIEKASGEDWSDIVAMTKI